MTSAAEWQLIRHFRQEEFFDPERMDFDFLKQLDAFREKIAEPVLINFSNGQEKHAAGSLHYEGKAVDLMFQRRIGLDDFILATRYFSEVGLYRDWKREGLSCGGLHVGYERFAISFSMQRKYWLAHKQDGTTVYEAFCLDGLKRLGFV